MGPIGNYWNAPSFVPVARWIGGELLAIRGWRLARWKEDGQLRLQSMTREEVWHGPVFTADYLPTASVGCGSGVYALKPSHRPHTLYEAPDQADYDWLSGRHAWIWGWVSLVGQVVEH